MAERGMDGSEPDFIKLLKNGSAQQDGQAVAFSIETKNGNEHSYACTIANFEKLLNWLIGLGLLADSQRADADIVADRAAKKTISAVPIRSKQIAAGAGGAPGELVIGFDLGAFDLAFSLPPEAVGQLRRAMAKLSAA
jgi:hypothetical protein